VVHPPERQVLVAVAARDAVVEAKGVV
jgi:hypothetical protein